MLKAVVVARKKDSGTGKWSKLRFCVNYIKVDHVTKRDRYPLQRIDPLLESAAGRCFSQLDATSGFWQINMHLGSVEKTVFITPDGLYECVRMPFGLANAPLVYQTMMDEAFSRPREQRRSPETPPRAAIQNRYELPWPGSLAWELERPKARGTFIRKPVVKKIRVVRWAGGQMKKNVFHRELLTSLFIRYFNRIILL